MKPPALLVAGFLDELDHVSDLIRNDPLPLGLSLKPLLIDPLWSYVEASGGSNTSTEAAQDLAQVAEDVLHEIRQGSIERASLMAGRFEQAALRFRASFDYTIYHELPKAQTQRAKAGRMGGKEPKRSKVRALLVEAFRVRRTDGGLTMHDALVALKTSPEGSLRVEKVKGGWRIEDEDEANDTGHGVETLDEGQLKGLWKAAGKEPAKKSGK
jgi:hypothetical protein